MSGKARPMKERELREHAVCSLCNRRIGECGVPIFYRLQIDTFGVDLNALQRQQGLAMQLDGNAAIAAAMGTDEYLAHSMGDTATLTVCHQCAIDARYPVAYLVEVAGDEQDEADEKSERDTDGEGQ